MDLRSVVRASAGRFAPLALVGAACGGPAGGVRLAPPPAPETRAVLAGPLCAGPRCQCRDLEAPGDGGAGVPAEGRKRFEVRLGPSPHPLWATVGDAQLYKSAERPEECFYLDLAPGKVPVSLRAPGGAGVSAAVALRELGAATGSWYESFRLACGAPGACTRDELAAEKARLAAAPHGIHDPCGSAKVTGLRWTSSAAPGGEARLVDLRVDLTLQVYRFAPARPHGDGACVAPVEGPAAAGEAAGEADGAADGAGGAPRPPGDAP